MNRVPMAERPVARGAGGRFTRRGATADASPAPEADANARPAREATPYPAPSIRLTFGAEDVTPAAPGVIAAPAPPRPDVSPEVDTPLARSLAKAIDVLIGATAGREYRAPEPKVLDVGDAAAPLIRRAAERFGVGEVAGAALPEWVVEVIDLGAAVYVAWGDAAAHAWRVAIERRRRKDADDDAPGRPAATGDRHAGERDRDTRSDALPADDGGGWPEPGPPVRVRHPGDADDERGELLALTARIRGVRPVASGLGRGVGE